MRKLRPFYPDPTEREDIVVTDVGTARKVARRSGAPLIAAVDGIDYLVLAYPGQHVTLFPYINDTRWRDRR